MQSTPVKLVSINNPSPQMDNLLMNLRPLLISTILLLVIMSPLSRARAQAPDALSKPEALFEELWTTFAHRYAFFELRGVDWDAQRSKYRPLVTAETSDDQLFDIFCKMLKPLNDGHVNLKARGSKKPSFNAETEARFYQEFSSGKKLKQYARAVARTLEKEGFGPPQKRTNILVYRTSEKYGYLQVLEVEGPSTKKLNVALDEIITAFQGKQGVIIDIRDNPGGTDKCVYTIVSRFADKKCVGHYRRTRRGPGPDDYSEKKTVYLEPHPKLTYTGPTICLTNDASFSGADVFAMLMTSLPQVTLVGEPSNGIFSNMLEKKLSNGWKYSLSHQRYYSAEMVCYEGKGIPVDIPVKNTWIEVEKDIDQVLLTGLQQLAKPKP